LDKFLKSFKSNYYNPFLNKYFFLVGEEIYGKSQNLHKIGGISRIFQKNDLIVKFEKKESVLGVALSVRTLCDPYGLDYFKISVNDREVEFDLSLVVEEVSLFRFLFDLVERVDDEEIRIKIGFTDSDSLTYSKQVLFYIIDEDHEDHFYRDEELKRWEDKAADCN